jgi:hypothetical protein
MVSVDDYRTKTNKGDVLLVHYQIGIQVEQEL